MKTLDDLATWIGIITNSIPGVDKAAAVYSKKPSTNEWHHIGVYLETNSWESGVDSMSIEFYPVREVRHDGKKIEPRDGNIELFMDRGELALCKRSRLGNDVPFDIDCNTIPASLDTIKPKKDEKDAIIEDVEKKDKNLASMLGTLGTFSSIETPHSNELEWFMNETMDAIKQRVVRAGQVSMMRRKFNEGNITSAKDVTKFVNNFKRDIETWHDTEVQKRHLNWIMDETRMTRRLLDPGEIQQLVTKILPLPRYFYRNSTEKKGDWSSAIDAGESLKFINNAFIFKAKRGIVSTNDYIDMRMYHEENGARKVTVRPTTSETIARRTNSGFQGEMSPFYSRELNMIRTIMSNARD